MTPDYEAAVVATTVSLATLLIILSFVWARHIVTRRMEASRAAKARLSSRIEVVAEMTEGDKFAVTSAFERSRNDGKVAILPAGLSYLPVGRHCRCGEPCRNSAAYCPHCGCRLSYTVA